MSQYRVIRAERLGLWLKSEALNALVKAGLMLAALLYLFAELSERGAGLLALPGVFTFGGSVYVLALVGLMPLNWALEALKWKESLRPVSRLSFAEAFKGVLAGVACGIWMPQGAGAFVGRIGFSKNLGRRSALVPVAVGSASQMVWTLLFGLCALIYWERQSAFDFPYGYAFLVLVIVLLCVSPFFAKRAFPRLKLWARFLKVNATCLAPELLARVFVLAFVRYGIFFLQYLLALWLFGVSLPVEVMMAGIAWVFLAKTVSPTFNALGDAGIREASSVLFFGMFTENVAPVVQASLVLWALNRVLPALVGLFFLRKGKWL
ncbi:hypothetical protein FUAX_30500 [Fulvitalea axinellae]|uniref:Lysylphosphatidylglycerol synthase TM region n=1 Tax=Fulvitalea axinellae TaxID=1182444 RepID=A0AAU9CKB3_9BACT|nr:hypothetical protein FUAX_30500 [Fulvitalea axinellae]